MRTAIYFVSLAMADVLIQAPSKSIGYALIFFLFMFLTMDIYALKRGI